MGESSSVTVSRLTIATAADFPRDYSEEFEQSGADGQYAAELRDTAAALQSALNDGNRFERPHEE